MLLRDNELARKVEGKLQLRDHPMRVHWTLTDLCSSDNHDLVIHFICSAKVIADPTEQQMFEEVLLGSRYSLTEDDLAAHFAPTLRSAAARITQTHAATAWINGDNAQELTDALHKAASSIAFGCGIELLPPFQLEITSPSFQRQQQRSRQQAFAERQTAEQVEHVQRAAELLKQFQSIRQSAPDLSPGRVLQQISAADRGAVLQSVLLASAKQAENDRLWAVAGPYLVRIDLASGPPQPRLLPLPPTLGPLRSIQAADVDGKRMLLAGARGGFILIDPENPTNAKLFSDRATESQLGFNQVVYWGKKQGFVASHGDAGIVQWSAEAPDSPAAALRPSQFLAGPAMITSDSGSTHTAGPRNVQPLDDRYVAFSAATKLFITDLQAAQFIPTESSAEITAILPEDDRLLILFEDGAVGSLDRKTRQFTNLFRRGTRIRSAGALPWLGTSRLLLAGDDGPVQCIGLDDPLLSEYQSAHRGLRIVAGSSSVIAGVSSDRQRLILWQSWDGRQPLMEVYLTGLTRHRIADITFG